MRIALPPEHQDVPFAHVGDHYAPEIVSRAGAYGSAPYQFSKLSLREVEAARFRTAQINGCNTCINFRGARDFPGMFAAFDWNLASSVHGRGPAPDEDFYKNIESWRDWPGYSERERLAVWYAEGLGQDPHGIAQDEAFWTRAKAAFSDEEIVDLSYSIAAWMATGRVLHALGLDTVCFADLAHAAE
jgi:alkylhydroperoxidase family enzyme